MFNICPLHGRVGSCYHLTDEEIEKVSELSRQVVH